MTSGAFLTVLVVGLGAAWLAASFMKDGGYGLVWDIVLALAGSALAYWIVQALGISPDGGLLATMVVAFVGAASLIGAQRKFWHNAPLKNGRLAPRSRRA
jgi:uncharacterized membrane protein YeaQ/YmgE (transglycosylase-associated protein family)